MFFRNLKELFSAFIGEICVFPSELNRRFRR